MKTKILLCSAIFTQDEKTLAPGHFAVSSGGGFFNDNAKDVDRVEQLQRSWSRILQSFCPGSKSVCLSDLVYEANSFIIEFCTA